MNICALQHHRVLNLFDSYTPCTMDTIATIARHHPYDIQILKYFPERDVSILSESEYRTLYDESITLEQRATRPTIGPRKSFPLVHTKSSNWGWKNGEKQHYTVSTYVYLVSRIRPRW
jgi:hypothetical protein